MRNILRKKKGMKPLTKLNPEVEPENSTHKKENLNPSYIETKDLRGQDPER
jgi:hypothetical protein